MPLLTGILSTVAIATAGAVAVTTKRQDDPNWWERPGAWVDQRDLRRIREKNHDTR